MSKYIFIKHKNIQDSKQQRGVVYHISLNETDKNNQNLFLNLRHEKNGEYYDNGTWQTVDDNFEVNLGDAFDGRRFMKQEEYAEARRIGAISW